MAKFILGIDQSTHGTKAIIFDQNGKIVKRCDAAHRQIINHLGWIEHDAHEIYKNMRKAVKNVIEAASISERDISAIGLCNQRETIVAWDKKTQKAICNAIVWQCSRAESVCSHISEQASEVIQKNTGLPLSPYFSAAKIRWLYENNMDFQVSANAGTLCCGTIDSWLLYCMTEGQCFKSDVSNASRTQLLNIHSLSWDDMCCKIFGIQKEWLAQIHSSSDYFGETNFNGLFERKIPIFSMLGDSQAALFGEGCHNIGDTKVTCGTGASAMMNIGCHHTLNSPMLAISVGWAIDQQPIYVLEGNINYAGAALDWLIRDLGLIKSESEIDGYIQKSDKTDNVCFVPAFSGLGAPYWQPKAKAVLSGMTRKSGKPEIIRAAVESIAYQIADIVTEMHKVNMIHTKVLKCDGAPSRNQYMMQFLSNLLDASINVPKNDELSCIGAAYMAGIRAGIYDKNQLFSNQEYICYMPSADEQWRQKKLMMWHQAVKKCIL